MAKEGNNPQNKLSGELAEHTYVYFMNDFTVENFRADIFE